MHPGAVGSFVCGSCAGVAYWVSIYPLDSVKSRVQVLSAQGKVAGLWRTFWNILTTEGISYTYILELSKSCLTLLLSFLLCIYMFCSYLVHALLFFVLLDVCLHMYMSVTLCLLLPYGE